jgi:hypothetical protein
MSKAWLRTGRDWLSYGNQECLWHSPKGKRETKMSESNETESFANSVEQGVSSHFSGRGKVPGNHNADERGAMKPARPTSQTAKRVGAIMHRKPSTRWMPKEIKAFQLLEPIEELDLASIERYYRINWPPRHGKNCLRTDLLTLLNHWPGELGRADTFNELHPDKPKPRKIIPLPPIPSEPLTLSAEDEEVREKFLDEMRRRNPTAKAYQPGDSFREAKKTMQGE